MSAHVARANLLMSQGRWEMAERELGQALAESPEDGYIYALLALCLAEQRKTPQALEIARQAISLDPDNPYCHYAHGLALEFDSKPREAEAALREAARLDPYDAGIFGALAAVLLQQARWTEALEAADQGLAINAQSQQCLNLRAVALTQLGRRDEARRTIAGGLERNPENAHSHANLGWSRLHEGRHKEALEHFREALRLDPELDWARSGLIEALKARYFLYRWLLRFFLWMSRFSGRAQLALIIGMYVLFRVLQGVADRNPRIEPYVAPVLTAYMIFAIMTWLANPFFELLLRLNRFGRYALSPQQTLASNVLLLAVLTCGSLIAAAFYFGRGDCLITALLLGVLTMPVTSVLRMPAGRKKRTLVFSTGALALLALAAIVTEWLDLPLRNVLFSLFLYAFLGHTFFMNWVMLRPGRN